MAVAVQQPRQKKDPLETILRGVQIAGGILGIKESLDKSERDEKKFELQKAQVIRDTLAQQRREKGELTAPEFAEMREKFTPVPEGTEGAIGGFTFQGEPQFFRPTAEITTEKELAAAKTAAEKEFAKARQKREDELRKEFDARIEKPNGPITQIRKARQIANIYTKDKNLSKADDVAAINLYARLLSPGIVTTQDFENVQRVGGYPERAKAWVEQVRGTGELTDSQRAELLAAVQSMTQGPLNEFNANAEFYSRLAKGGEVPVDVEDVIGPEKVEFVRGLDKTFDSAFERLGVSSAPLESELPDLISQELQRRQQGQTAGQ